MGTSTVAGALALLEHYKYAIIFPISVFEGPVIGVVSGALASSGILNPFAVFVLLLAGDTVGDLFYYALGRFGGNAVVTNWGHRLRLTPTYVVRFERQFRMHDWKMLLISKIDLTGLPTGVAILFSAGIARVPVASFLWYTVIPGIPRILFLEGIGLYIGQGFVLGSAEILKRLGIASGVLLVILVGTFILLHKYRTNNDQSV